MMTRNATSVAASTPAAGAQGATTVRSGFTVRGLRWWIAVLLMGITVINYLDRSVLSVAGPTLKGQLRINEVDFSHIVMAFQLAYLVMMPIAGRFIDWLDIRRGMAISIAGWSVAQMATALGESWVSFAFFRGLLGVTEAGNFPGAIKAVSQWFRPKERTLATGIFNMGAGLGALVAPPLVAFLILKFSWQTAFVVTGIFGFAWVVVWQLCYRSPDKHPWLSKEELAYIREGQSELTVAEAPKGHGVWRVVVPQRNFWAIGIARFMSEPAWQFFTYWIPLYLATERHLNLKQIGYFAWVPFLAADLGSAFGGVLSPIFIKLRLPILVARKCAATVCALLMVFAVFIGTAPSVGWAIFFFCIGAFAHQAMSATLLTLPADVFPGKTVASANGLSGTMAILGGMLFTMVIGKVAQTIGYGPLFTSIAFFDIVGVSFLWILLRQPPAAHAKQEG